MGELLPELGRLFILDWPIFGVRLCLPMDDNVFEIIELFAWASTLSAIKLSLGFGFDTLFFSLSLTDTSCYISS